MIKKKLLSFFLGFGPKFFWLLSENIWIWPEKFRQSLSILLCMCAGEFLAKLFCKKVRSFSRDFNEEIFKTAMYVSRGWLWQQKFTLHRFWLSERKKFKFLPKSISTCWLTKRSRCHQQKLSVFFPKNFIIF